MKTLHVIATIAITLVLPLCIMVWIAVANDDYQSAYNLLASAYTLMGIALICQTIRNMHANRNGQKTSTATRKSLEPIGHIECYCGEEMPIYGDMEVLGEPGQQTATVSVDTSALWLHSFQKHPDAHKEEA